MTKATLQTGRALGPGEAWSALGKLLGRLSTTDNPSRCFEACLDDLLAILEADRSLVLAVHPGGGVSTVAARSRKRPLEDAEREAISRTILRSVLASGEVAVTRPLDEQGATESMAAFGIGAAMAAPLRALRWTAGEDAPDPHGIVYVDWRSPRRVVTELERELLQAVAHALGTVLVPYQKLANAREELRSLAAREPSEPDLEEMLRWPSMAETRAEVSSLLRGSSAVLVLGESGTGKTHLARAFAAASGRGPVVRAVLGSSDDLNTITSELFGHEKGSFSGALARRTGLVEFADGGTLVFDEILNLPARAQQLLLDFTQFGTYRPLGWDKREPKRADVRIVAATNGDLERAMREGRFREDLYHRLSTAVLVLPPLRERRGEIPALAESLLRREDPGKPMRLGQGVATLLAAPDLTWAGNVRQLEGAVRRARERALAERLDAAVLERRHLSERDLGGASRPARRAGAPAPRAEERPTGSSDLGEQWSTVQQDRRAVDASERALVEAALARHGGVVAHAARELGIARTTLSSRLAAFGKR